MDTVPFVDSPVPLIPLDLDRRRHLRLNNRALGAAELELGQLWHREVNIITVLANPGGLGLNATAVLLWCGLRHEDPSLTLDQVFDMLNLLRLADVQQAIYSTWNAATVAAELQDLEERSDPLASASPGGDSGASRALN